MYTRKEIPYTHNTNFQPLIFINWIYWIRQTKSESIYMLILYKILTLFELNFLWCKIPPKEECIFTITHHIMSNNPINENPRNKPVSKQIRYDSGRDENITY